MIRIVWNANAAFMENAVPAFDDGEHEYFVHKRNSSWSIFKCKPGHDAHEEYVVTRKKDVFRCSCPGFKNLTCRHIKFVFSSERISE